MKTCAKCNELKPFDLFHPNIKMKSGYNSYCKKCQLKASADYQRRNKDALLEARRNPCSKAAVDAKLRKTRAKLERGINYAPVVFGGYNTL
jgi:hypothetical protein